MAVLHLKFYILNVTPAHFIIPIAALLSLTPWISSGVALVMGLALALIFGNPYILKIKNITHKLLAISVMGLGAGMNLGVIGKVGLQGVGYTVIGIFTALIIGTLLGKILKTEKDTSLLISVGTAICGGSAIAAVSPVIKARHHEVTVALGTVFMLNAAALFLFPWIGHHFELSQAQFGLWSALAIHDTSSVVGATLQYGAEAVEIGTTVKLARALWIVPVAMMIGLLRAKTNKVESSTQKAKRPWFILGFILAAAIVTWIPSLQPAGHMIEAVAKRLMVLTLFLIGSGLTRETISNVGVKPFIQGICLWLIMASGTLASIVYGVI